MHRGVLMTRETLIKANQLMDQIERIGTILSVIGVFGETKPEDSMKFSNCELVNHATHESVVLNEGERGAIVTAIIKYRNSLEEEFELIGEEIMPVKDGLKMRRDYIRRVVAKHNLAVETKDLPEDDPNMLFVKSTDFAKLQAIADEVKETLGDTVKFATYYPTSGLMYELTLGFIVADKTSV